MFTSTCRDVQAQMCHRGIGIAAMLPGTHGDAIAGLQSIQMPPRHVTIISGISIAAVHTGYRRCIAGEFRNTSKVGMFFGARAFAVAPAEVNRCYTCSGLKL